MSFGWNKRDAQGNVLSIYRKSVILPRNETYFFWEEQTLYGSSRLGTEQVEHSMRGLVTNDALTDEITRAREQHGDDWQQRLDEQYEGRFYERLQEAWGNEWSTRLDLVLQGNNDGWLIEQIRNESYTLQVGNKRYELSNHLGNVLAVVSDKKEQSDGVSWSAVVISATDYFPFGMAMPGRSSGAYRYGFNGKETDPETGLNDFGARLYDGRLGRWFSPDPLSAKTPQLTPYRFGFNNPITYKDPDGAWEEDGHFWTVYAFGIAVGLRKETAYALAVRAEFYDHHVSYASSHSKYETGITMKINPLWESGFGSWGSDGGLGTWADEDLQDYAHGLNGKIQVEQLNDAATRVLSGNLDQLHTIGDSWAHSYLNSSGVRVMYGDESTKIYIPFLGRITFEHALQGPAGHEHADEIQKRPVEYEGYIKSLKSLYTNKSFAYSDQVKKGNIDLSIFGFVQKNGQDKHSNIFLFDSYIGYMTGQKNFYDKGDGKNLRLFQEYLSTQNVKSSISCDKIDTNSSYWSLKIE